MEIKPNLYLVCGPNATFKSTFCPVLVENPNNSVFIDFDEEKYKLLNNNQAHISNIYELVNAKLKEIEISAFREKKDIVFQSNLLDPDDLLIFHDKALKNNYAFNGIYFNNDSIYQNIAINAVRGLHGKHCVSRYTIELSRENSMHAIKQYFDKFSTLKVFDVSKDTYKDKYIENLQSDLKRDSGLVEPKLNLEIHRGRIVYKSSQMASFASEIAKAIIKNNYRNRPGVG